MSIENQQESLTPIEVDFLENAHRGLALRALLKQTNILSDVGFPEETTKALERLSKEISENAANFDISSQRRVQILKKAGLQTAKNETEPLADLVSTEITPDGYVECPSDPETLATIRELLEHVENRVKNKDERYTAPEARRVPSKDVCEIHILQRLLQGGFTKSEHIIKDLWREYPAIDLDVFNDAWNETMKLIGKQ